MQQPEDLAEKAHGGQAFQNTGNAALVFRQGFITETTALQLNPAWAWPRAFGNEVQEEPRRGIVKNRSGQAGLVLTFETVGKLEQQISHLRSSLRMGQSVEGSIRVLTRPPGILRIFGGC